MTRVSMEQLPMLLSDLVWQDSRSVAMVSLLLIVLSLAALIFYAPQWKLIRIRYRIILIGLRLLGLLALAISLLQPVITRQLKTAGKGIVVIAVDHSFSMDVQDRQRKPAQWVALADGMGRLPEGLRSRPVKITAAAEDIRFRFDEVNTAQSELDYATVSGRSTVEAVSRWNLAYSEFRKAISTLAAISDMDLKSKLPVILKNLQKLSETKTDHRPDDKQIAEIRLSIAELISAASEFRVTFDQSLYATNLQVKGVCDELSKLSRLQLVEQAIVHPDSGLLHSLSKSWEIFGYSLGDTVEPVPLQNNGMPVRRLLVNADSNWQDPFASIRAVLDNLPGVPVDAVIYFSDGHLAGENNSVSGKSRAGTVDGSSIQWAGKTPMNRLVNHATGRKVALNVPVIAVAAAAGKTNAPDWSLSHAAIPSSVYVGELFTVRARVRGTGFKPGAAVEVSCEIDPEQFGYEANMEGERPRSLHPVQRADGGVRPPEKRDADQLTGSAANSATQPLSKGTALASNPRPLPRNIQTRKVILKPDLTAEVDFQVEISSAGLHQVSLKLPQLANELSKENNTVQRWVKVIDQKQKVVIIAESAGWDYRQLRNAAAEMAGVEVITQVLDGSPCNLTVDQLRQQDCIVLFDVAASALDASQWSAIDSVATRKGGLIVLIAGNEHLPGEYTNAPMRDWLPYWTDSATALAAGAVLSKTSTPTSMASTDDARSIFWRTWKGQHPAYRLMPSNLLQNNLHLVSAGNTQFQSNEQRAWDSLSGVFRYLSIPTLKPNVKAIVIEKESQEAVITEMPLGNGRVIFLGTDELWRLRLRNMNNNARSMSRSGASDGMIGVEIGDGVADVIWHRLLNGFIDPPYAIRNKGISLDIVNSGLAPGEPVEVRCKLTDVKTLWPVDAQSVSVLLTKNGQVIRKQTLPADSGNPGRYVGSLMGLEPGQYEIEASAEGYSVQYPLHVVRHYNIEMDDSSGNISTLADIAQASGGRVISLEQVREIPSILAGMNQESRTVVFKLWDSAYLLVFVVSCFVFEWALRKRLGLA